MATRILNSRPEAEDALQEAFLRLWKAAPNWSAEGARFSTWFYRVVMNLCIDAKRRRKAPHVALDDAPEVADSTPGAEAHLRQQEQNAALRRAMEELPERQRHAVQLCYFDGMSNKQAAEILEVNIKALESLLSRGRRALKQILAGQEMTDNPGGTP